MSNKEVHIPFCKTIHATKEDFADFQGFVNRVETDPEVQKAGVVKVIRNSARSSLLQSGNLLCINMKSS